MTNIKLSIVIPVYRSQKILGNLLVEIDKVAKHLGLSKEFELILVNDGSPDQSWSVIKELSERYDFLTGVCLMRNFGQHNATMAGLNQAKGDVVVIMDDDLQHPPAEIPRLIEAINGGADVCYVNYLGRKHAAWKKLGSNFNNWVATMLLKKPKDLYLSSFKAIRKEIVREMIKYNGPFTYLDGLILDLTRNISTIDIMHNERFEGEGNYNLKNSLALWLKMATSFSIVPLRLAAISGCVIAMLSGILIFAAVVRKVLYPEIQSGWASLMSITLFLGGAQLGSIGLLGEYLGRAYLVLNRSPQYAIREMTKKST